MYSTHIFENLTVHVNVGTMLNDTLFHKRYCILILNQIIELIIILL